MEYFFIYGGNGDYYATDGILGTKVRTESGTIGWVSRFCYFFSFLWPFLESVDDGFFSMSPEPPAVASSIFTIDGVLHSRRPDGDDGYHYEILQPDTEGQGRGGRGGDGGG